MQTLKEIKKRVTSVKNTQKITNAMKLVASAKFNKANKAVRGARPYSNELSQLMTQLVGEDVEHPLLTAPQATTQVLVVVFSSDRGLCGALNANLFKHLRHELLQHYGEDFAAQVDFIALGKKAEQFCRKNNFNLVQVEHRVEHLDQASWPLAFSRQLRTHFRQKNTQAYTSLISSSSPPCNNARCSNKFCLSALIARRKTRAPQMSCGAMRLGV